jgi:histidinol phosphatase-like PHP family hydrolase
MLQRRVGGILKGIAPVKKLTSQEVEGDSGDIFVCLAYGYNYENLTQRFRHQDKIVIGVEMNLLPQAIRVVRQLDESWTLGVLSNHQRCANTFCSDIIRSTLSGHVYTTSTFEDLDKLKVDAYLVPEELAASTSSLKFAKPVYYLPRAISAQSAALLIDHALRLANNL